MNERIVIVGAGHGGFQLAASLRQSGYAGAVILVGDEPGLPYQRPPLSKAYLLDKLPLSELFFRPEDFFSESGIQRVTATAIDIDRKKRRVLLDHGEAVEYDRLVLATGARRRRLPVEGADVDGVHGLATLADADKLKSALRVGCQSAIIIGAGFIGLEFASVANLLGLEVTVVDAASRAMARAVSPAVSAFFEAHHSRQGMKFRFGEGVASIIGSGGRAKGVETSSGQLLSADIIVTGIGVVPNDRLARAAGLEVENGIIVDAQLTTSDPNIFAIGDCCNFLLGSSGTRCRLESVQNATDQARLLAARFAKDQFALYDAVPWFWSDQGSLKLQIAGVSAECDEFVQVQDVKGLSVLCFRHGVLAAVESINRPADHMAARRLLASTGRRPTPIEAGLKDFDLKRFTIEAAA
ncbi:NAD(P)/FAD-dependent oxidoreductase [Rhizobium ruizarguesonis]|uniref:NAD(P)/FAD-dependent oxidoreductase n=1 Tax=Rhizobium ruizarguesonis TaxID=2081791 RepID=UPI0003F63262|nr:FAD-dependent oxidoreductase [Rhizobium ruizarguesonis]MBY5851569.1 FAD-dependent oxidoreductase [Rhizobium leguminosarum]NKL13333.1 pyridine nucleotide-disulfide oxidoreductase [Rhizobium leguminosarum bv. viciae]MBY5873428.1 FAD-dependent oxidoreductase [Rhizobium leguminosarum]MBY5892446.1 FAD-dependent oxidoreductase [Rhizobium leguminosarum]NEH38213.1 pyridine nucleotide-disulfide oxidoreductase [Rhizobium ruizarguesonis]